MLQAQVNYWNYREAQRHSKVMERIEENKVQVEMAKLREQNRHAIATEIQSFQDYMETQRSNMERERQNLLSIENERRKVDLGYKSLDETIRHNKVTESISTVANKIAWTNAATNQTNAKANMAQARAATANSQTNRINAQTNQYSALKQGQIGYMNALTNQLNANTNEANMHVNAFNAQVNSYKATTGAGQGMVNAISGALRAAGSLAK